MRASVRLQSLSLSTVGRNVSQRWNIARYRLDTHDAQTDFLAGIGSQDGYVHFFDVHKGGTGPRNPLRSFQAHKSAVHTLTFAQHSRNVATMADDGDVRIWDISVPKSDTPVWQATAHSDHIRCGAFTNESDNLILTGMWLSIRFYMAMKTFYHLLQYCNAVSRIV